MTMKIVSSLGTTKADKQIKVNNLINAHGRTVRLEGKSYRVRVATLGGVAFVDAERPGETINILAKAGIAPILRRLCENRLYS